jgi:hypothetical protein
MRVHNGTVRCVVDSHSNKEAILIAVKENVLGVSAEKTQYMVMSGD